MAGEVQVKERMFYKILILHHHFTSVANTL